MTDPNPRRFRFSLSFLLAWVLLTSALLGLAIFAYQRPPTFFNTQHPVNVEVICHDKTTLSGWPVWALRQVERTEIELPHEKDFLIHNAELSEEQRATEVGHLYFREYNPEGLALNLAFCVLFSGLLCFSARWIFRSRADHTALIVVPHE